MPKMRMMAMAGPADVPTEVAAGDLTVTRRIRAWFGSGLSEPEVSDVRLIF